ncbi:hypothetical protein M3Y95_00439000 [Aphelenchoides besseyi]|nr:hypothetical protein M3Y95_00439000 [Aphelenchoides besseyi]
MDVIFRQSVKFHSWYNCSFYSVDQVPLEKRQHVGYGVGIILMGLFFESLYAPCVYALLHKELFKNFCYKLILIMAVFEMCLLPLTCIIPGYFSINGYMYCSSPKLQLFSGIAVFSLWIAYSVTCFILSLNRCLAQTNSLGQIFEGRNAERFWLGLPFVVLILVAIFCQPSFFSSIHGAYFFNPHAGYFEDTQNKYPTAMHLINNLGFAIVMPTMYLIYFITNIYWSKQVMRKLSARELSLFIQVLVINGVLAMTSTLYVMSQYIHVPEELTYTSHLIWACSTNRLVDNEREYSSYRLPTTSNECGCNEHQSTN